IKFTGVIAEIKKSRVVFRSSGDDKIICELVSPVGTGKDGPVVGGPLTVIGRVRGRGMMGNFTLDPWVRTLVEPEPAPAPGPVAAAEAVREKVEPAVVVAEPEPEPVAELAPPDAPKKEPVARVSSAPPAKVPIATRPLPAADDPVVEKAASDAG